MKLSNRVKAILLTIFAIILAGIIAPIVVQCDMLMFIKQPIILIPVVIFGFIMQINLKKAFDFDDEFKKSKKVDGK